MDFKNGFSTFMNTERESRLWHKGIYKGLKKGLKIHNPKKIYKNLKLSEMDYKEWYESDGHYFDVPFVSMYLLSTAIEAGIAYKFGPEAVKFLSSLL